MKITFSIFILLTTLYLGTYAKSGGAIDTFSQLEKQEVGNAEFSDFGNSEASNEAPYSDEADESDSGDDEQCCLFLNVQDTFLSLKFSSEFFTKSLYCSSYINRNAKPPRC